MNTDDITNRFSFHSADTKAKQDAHSDVRHICRNAAHLLNDLLPDGREKSLAITKLEESMFWANAAVARPQLET